MKVLIRLCRCNRLICAIDVRKGIKQVSLWPGSIFFITSRGGQKGQLQIMARLYLFFITSRGGQKGHCRIMNDFFLAFGGWGGGGHKNLPPTFTPTPLNPYIFVWVWWLKGQAGYPGFCMASTGNYQTSRNYFCSLEITCIRRKVLFVLEFYGPVSSI